MVCNYLGANQVHFKLLTFSAMIVAHTSNESLG